MRVGASSPSRLRGGPLVLLAVVLTGWSAGRAMWWEGPPATPLAALPDWSMAPALAVPLALSGAGGAGAAGPGAFAVLDTAGAPLRSPMLHAASSWRGPVRRAASGDMQVVAAHQLLWLAAMREPLGREPLGRGGLADAGEGWPDPPPFLPAPAQAAAAGGSWGGRGGGRWSLDAWAFWRQGSDSAPVSQGRVPIYGASQAGAVLQYRLAPGSRRDPRLYARAYRALVRRGESEAALGASARPFARVPLRAAGEVRYTAAAFSDSWRPAAYVVTELPPLALPYGARAEAYGQAGWVGGPDPTGFADGQASITGELRKVARLTDNTLRFSLGAAAWGGAQKDAQRIDIGPTLRLDLTVGAVPARLSLDWRERVQGDASPGSGVAATFSTGF